jgi:hypothetical protein
VVVGGYFDFGCYGSHAAGAATTAPLEACQRRRLRQWWCGLGTTDLGRPRPDLVVVRGQVHNSGCVAVAVGAADVEARGIVAVVVRMAAHAGDDGGSGPCQDTCDDASSSHNSAGLQRRG